MMQHISNRRELRESRLVWVLWV